MKDLDSWLQGVVICMLVDQDKFLGKGVICTGGCISALDVKYMFLIKVITNL